MNVLVIGANGTTGKMVVEKIGQSEQHIARAMVRKTEQAPELEKLGARPIIADLEQEFAFAMEDVNAVIFAAGSGGHTGPDKTTAVDEKGAIKAIDYAREKGIERFIMLSSVGADNPSLGGESMEHYLKAKQSADEHLKNSGLNYTIVRPGALSDDPATGKLVAAPKLTSTDGEISREDVATVLVEALLLENLENKTFEMLNGEEPIESALKAI